MRVHAAIVRGCLLERVKIPTLDLTDDVDVAPV